MLRAVLVLVLVALPARAFAHQTSVKYVDLAIDGSRVEVALQCASFDVTEPLGLESDAKPSVADALAHAAVPPYVQRWLVLAGCTVDAPRAARVDDTFIRVTWAATCAQTDELAIDFRALFALDERQEVIVRLTAPGVQTIQTIVRADEAQTTLRAGHAPSLLAWVRTGMDHIYEGIDHILFVLALLLVVMLYRGAGTWHTRAFWPTLRSTAGVITAFTIAHSISLIAAALGLIQLPGAFVEAVIALSIAYTAAEDVVRPDVRWRFSLTFAFGLVHGLGFASSLAELLPPSDIVLPLLCFNIGVEVGQLTVVLVALPAFFGLARLLGGERYRRLALPALAGFVFLVGLAMAFERLFDVRILPM